MTDTASTHDSPPPAAASAETAVGDHQGTVPAAPPTTAEAHRPGRAQTYHRTQRRLHIAELAITLVYWVAWQWPAPAFGAWVSDAVDSRWAALAIAALVMIGGLVLLELPLTYYSGYVVEQRYGLSNQTHKAWLIFQLKAYAVGAIIGAIILGGLYALLWYAGWSWSVWLWCGVMLLSVVLAKIFPLLILPLFYPSKPLERPSLIERLEHLAGGTGLRLTGVFNLELSKDTKKVNAMLAGLGSSRRVYLADTLLDAFTDDEIAVVFAHELGHHIRGHIYKGIALTAVISSLLVALIHWRLNPFAGPTADWSQAIVRLADVMLISFAFPLLISPISNAISRRFERQCDSDALRLTRDPQAYRSAFSRLGDINLSDPNPPRWEEVLFDDHPALAKRIAYADEYERMHAS